LSKQATAKACSNIAFIKYWGNRDPELRLPFNDSLSMNLSQATTTTTVTFRDDIQADSITVDGAPLDGAGWQRVSTHLDHVRRMAGISLRADVVSANTFPMGTGIASSASGFAALSLAAASAAELKMSEREMSCLARLGSGSAARSIPEGFVEWLAGASHQECNARSIAQPEHWDLRDIVAVVSLKHKTVGSGGGHDAAATSSYFEARLAELGTRLPLMKEALLDRDLARLGPALEIEALSLHAVALTSRPPILYWEPATIALMRQTETWRRQGLPVYYTLDAGPNVHLIVEGEHAKDLERELSALDYVEMSLHNRPGPAAGLVAD